MDYCGPNGIPHSRFLGWSEDDQDKALAWQRHVALACAGCGTREAEWEADPLAWMGDIVHCPGCAALEQERENIPPESPRGLRVRLVPRAVAEARAARGEGMT